MHSQKSQGHPYKCIMYIYGTLWMYDVHLFLEGTFESLITHAPHQGEKPGCSTKLPTNYE